MRTPIPTHNNQLSAILNIIRKERKNRGFKQVDMANALKISHNSYNRKETGKISLTVTEFFIIAEVLGVEPIHLIGAGHMNIAAGK
jgi:transcriptional regulator with XRE-family HTH domain